MQKDKEKVKIQFRLEPETHKKLTEMAKADHRSLNSMFIHVIEEYHKKIFLEK